MADRKAELERKKERLRQMREEKERRKREKEKADADSAALAIKQAASAAGATSAPASTTASKGTGPLPPSAEVRETIDQVLKDIGIAPVGSVLDSMDRLPASTGSDNAPGVDAASGGGGASLAGGGGEGVGMGGALSPGLARRKELSLTMTTVHSTNIAPKEAVTYAKQTQTNESGPDVMGMSRHGRGIGGSGHDFYTLTYDEEEYEEDSLPGLGSNSPSSETGGYFNKLPPGILPHGMPEVKSIKPAVTKEEEKMNKQKEADEEERRKRKVIELSQEEKQAILMSDEFHKFFDRSTRLIERAMCEDYQSMFVDYTGGFEDGEGVLGDEEKSANRLSLNRYFFDDRWTKNRVVTSMDWSVAYPELMCASYDKNPDAAHDPDGVCLVWNTRFKKTTPEHIFHCQSAVMSATFARFHRNLIIGGTYSGQIVLWDNRVQKRTPVQRSPLSASAHTHPVYCTRVVGTENAHNLISVSTDGKLCTWSLDMLSQPQEVLELQQLQAKQSKPVAVTSLAFPTGDVNNFVVGSEEGNVYTACRHGSRVGVLDTFEGHGAPITGVSAHHANSGNVDFSHLFLTSSIDWSVKLWSLKENRWPLYSFESNDDYVYDVAWSPTHPSVFATVDGTGRLDIWNLNNDTEVSTASVVTEGPPAALNRVSWTPSGLHVCAGDDAGKIWVYDVGEALACPDSAEWGKFSHTLHDIKANKAGGGAGGIAGLDDETGGISAVTAAAAATTGPNSLTSFASLSSSPLR